MEGRQEGMVTRDEVSVLQVQVQRALGRFMLRMQQYERLLRAFLIEAHLAGCVTSVDADRSARAERFGRLSLGMLLQQFTAEYLEPVVELASSPSEPMFTTVTTSVDAPHVEIRTRLQLVRGDFERIDADLRQLLVIRNRVVHHLTEAFDIGTPGGCAGAQRELDEAYRKADSAIHLLRGWAEQQAATWRHAASIIASSEFHDLLSAESPMPALPLDRLVVLLRGAERLAAPDGWTCLDSAVRSIRTSEPEHAPSRYGRRAWHQVLTLSNAFELRRIRGTEATPGRRMYRSRPV